MALAWNCASVRRGDPPCFVDEECDGAAAQVCRRSIEPASGRREANERCFAYCVGAIDDAHGERRVACELCVGRSPYVSRTGCGRYVASCSTDGSTYVVREGGQLFKASSSEHRHHADTAPVGIRFRWKTSLAGEFGACRPSARWAASAGPPLASVCDALRIPRS